MSSNDRRGLVKERASFLLLWKLHFEIFVLPIVCVDDA